MKVYLVYKNSDMTEGRGPMLLDRVFLHKEHADDYVDAQPGVMGMREMWSRKKHGSWHVEETEVIEVSLVDKVKERRKIAEEAMKKLTPFEIEALGLRE